MPRKATNLVMTRKKGKKKGKSPKKLKFVSKKVTETWCYENTKKGKKRRKKREDSEDDMVF